MSIRYFPWPNLLSFYRINDKESNLYIILSKIIARSSFVSNIVWYSTIPSVWLNFFWHYLGIKIQSFIIDFICLTITD